MNFWMPGFHSWCPHPIPLSLVAPTFLGGTAATTSPPSWRASTTGPPPRRTSRRTSAAWRAPPGGTIWNSRPSPRCSAQGPARGDQVHRGPVSFGDGNNCAVDGFCLFVFAGSSSQRSASVLFNREKPRDDFTILHRGELPSV